jgi:uncharacterized protein YndB with AHSA1/START domain
MTTTSEQISEVTRSLGDRSLPAGQARVLTIAQTYRSDLADVWDAVTNAERIPRWLMPISGELRLGGRYQLHGNASGTIERCEPPRFFAATWEYGGQISWIEVTLTADGDDATRVQVEHIAHVDDETSALYGPGAVGIGWDMMLLGLSGHLGSGVGVSPENAEAWLVSPDGLAFMTASCHAWRDADIAYGTDPVAAREAADRCLAAYTGAPQADAGASEVDTGASQDDPGAPEVDAGASQDDPGAPQDEQG